MFKLVNLKYTILEVILYTISWLHSGQLCLQNLILLYKLMKHKLAPWCVYYSTYICGWHSVSFT